MSKPKWRKKAEERAKKKLSAIWANPVKASGLTIFICGGCVPAGVDGTRFKNLVSGRAIG